MAPSRASQQRQGSTAWDRRPSSACRLQRTLENFWYARTFPHEAYTITAEPFLADCAAPIISVGTHASTPTEASSAASKSSPSAKVPRGQMKVEDPILPEDGEKRQQWSDVLECNRAWHYRYNRNLSLFAHSISCLTFSRDARWLISGTGSGDLKVWDTAGWSMVQTLRGCRKEEPCSLIISPNQAWLVSVQPSALYIFQLRNPFILEQTIAAMICPGNKEASVWCCAAFSPSAESDHSPECHGASKHFVVLSTTHLCVFDYSDDWSSDVPRRTHSILRYARPSGVSYTPCKGWIIVAYDNGHMQIWNAHSLTLERKISAHDGAVRCMEMSPPESQYACRLVTVGQDRRIRIWHSLGWCLEEERKDKSQDEVGITGCSFSTTGTWLLTISRVLCIWRVCLNRDDRIWLCLHQRVDAIGSVDGVCSAAFSGSRDTLAVGSRDGALGVWSRFPGLPPDYPYEDDADEVADSRVEETGTAPAEADQEGLARRPRPMRRVRSLDIALDKYEARKVPSTGPEGWLQKWQLRSSTTVVPHPVLGAVLRQSGSAPSLQKNGALCDSLRSGVLHHSAVPISSKGGVGTPSGSNTDLRRWTCRHFEGAVKPFALKGAV